MIVSEYQLYKLKPARRIKATQKCWINWMDYVLFYTAG